MRVDVHCKLDIYSLFMYKLIQEESEMAITKTKKYKKKRKKQQRQQLKAKEDKKDARVV